MISGSSSKRRKNFNVTINCRVNMCYRIIDDNRRGEIESERNCRSYPESKFGFDINLANTVELKELTEKFEITLYERDIILSRCYKWLFADFSSC